ncbi:MAG: ATP-binding cassette domain-containing protein [Waddliaceae bacterium]
MIVVENVTIYPNKKRRKPILCDLNFRVAKNESLGLVGPSGCGKSTVLRTLSSLHPYWSGKIKVGCPRHHIQMVFQDPLASLHPRHTVYEILREPLIARKIPYDEQALLQALDDVSLSSELLFRYPHQLSGGQRQRASIARSLLVDPKVLFLDECTSALDVAVQKDILLLLKRLKKERGITCLVVSHNFEVIRFMCDRFLNLEDFGSWRSIDLEDFRSSALSSLK